MKNKLREKIPSIKIKVVFYHLTLSQLEKPDNNDSHSHSDGTFLILNYLQNVFWSWAIILYK